MDVTQHPIVLAAREAALNGAPAWFLTELFETQEFLSCAHSAAIVVLTDGRLLVQQRREGLQVFGGGKCQQSLMNKLHSVRRELFYESNIIADGSATAVRYISEPSLFYDALWKEATLLQVFVIDAKNFQVLENGTFAIESRLVWSRELAWINDDAAEVGWDWGQFGKFYCGLPVFELTPSVHTPVTFNSHLERFRPSDRDSLVKMLPQITTALQGTASNPSTFVVNQQGPIGYVEEARRFWDLWQQHCKDIATQPWPLIPTAHLYTTLVSPKWRSEQLRKGAQSATGHDPGKYVNEDVLHEGE